MITAIFWYVQWRPKGPWFVNLLDMNYVSHFNSAWSSNVCISTQVSYMQVCNKERRCLTGAQGIHLRWVYKKKIKHKELASQQDPQDGNQSPQAIHRFLVKYVHCWLMNSDSCFTSCVTYHSPTVSPYSWKQKSNPPQDKNQNQTCTCADKTPEVDLRGAAKLETTINVWKVVSSAKFPHPSTRPLTSPFSFFPFLVEGVEGLILTNIIHILLGFV